jgi:cytosine/adenosine deaminase-related metal-dependent hydrolase
MTAMGAGVCFVNAAMDGGATSLRVVGERIAGVGVRPARGDVVVDLDGDRLLPGLINAHDHLQFNNFARTRYRETHANVSEWIVDVTGRLGNDPLLDSAVSRPFEERLLAGGVKNLLSGVTTVAHHDDYHAAFADFPVRVPRAYGWVHSPGVSSAAQIKESFERTRATWPWIIHAGEGVDSRAAAEYTQLESLGCIGPNSLLVHGLGFTAGAQSQLMSRGAAVIACPSSNLFLFGQALEPSDLLAAGRLGLGTDSRLSGGPDLLEELRVARASWPQHAAELETLVTRHNARLLGLADRGALIRGLLADLLVVPAGKTLADLRRSDVVMVMIGGVMRYGACSRAAALGAAADCVPVRVDGYDKALDRRLVGTLAGCGWREPGLSFPEAEWRAA